MFEKRMGHTHRGHRYEDIIRYTLQEFRYRNIGEEVRERKTKKKKGREKKKVGFMEEFYLRW